MLFILIVVVLIPLLSSLVSKSRPRLLLGNFAYLLPVVVFLLGVFMFFQSKSVVVPVVEMQDPSLARILNLNFVFDTLSSLLLLTVGIIFSVTSRYSVKLLQEDKDSQQFLSSLSLTISFVLVMLLVDNLFYIYMFWKLISFSLTRLLCHFSDRRAAIEASDHALKFSRASELLLIAACAMIYFHGGSLSFNAIAVWMSSAVVAGGQFQASTIGLLIVVSCLMKSVQIPFHYWLPKTMETPVPVSALMHAGILNAGGYLLIRLHELWFHLPHLGILMSIVGAISATYGMMVMTTQTNVKQGLAYSTIAQMGFMMVQIGLGMYTFAILHMLGHAFYKSYAFLSSGTATDFARLGRYHKFEQPKASMIELVLYPLVWMLILLGVQFVFGYENRDMLGVNILLYILCLALAQISLNSVNRKLSVLVACIFATLYPALGWFIKLMTNSTGLEFFELSVFSISQAIFVCVSFTLLYVFVNTVSYWEKTKFGKRLYVFLYSGSLYSLLFKRKMN